MRCLLTILVSMGLTASIQPAAEAPRLLVDNARVRVFRMTADGIHGLPPSVVVSVDSGSDEGTALWVDDAAAVSAVTRMHGAFVVVQPINTRASPPPLSATRPGEAPFTGMSFKPMFENDRVSVIRARMEVGAREGFHTHGSDTIVIHLSGGEVEDTANGKTVVNRWKRGDVEFEEIGSSHSARNLGGAVDVVLVALKRPTAGR